MIICVARLADSKGLDRLLDASRALVDRGYRFRVFVVGDGPMEEKLKAMRDELGPDRYSDLHRAAEGRSGSAGGQ